MADFDEYGTALEEPAGPRASGRRLAGIGQRLAQTFSRVDSPPEAYDDPCGPQTVSYQDDMPRFAIVRRGYHCLSVDEYVGELEQELGELDREIAQLRAETPAAAPQPPPADVSGELKRIGEQTSAVLIAAHEQAQEIVREAESEAEAKLTKTKADAEAMVGRAEQRLRDLELETESVHRERARLLDDVRSASAALSELADVSLQRFPPQPGSAESENDQQATDSYPVPA